MSADVIEFPISADFDRLDEVCLATVHFNPCGYHRLRETYYEWLPTLGPLARALKCYELVFDDDQPEIEGSIVIRGTREHNLMFQKENLLNIALSKCGPEIKYFGWLDHDFVNSETQWLAKAVDKIDQGAIAVQLLSRAVWLKQDRTIDNVVVGAVKRWKTHGDSNGNPGAIWLASRAYLSSIGGFNTANIVGGGDQVFIDGVVGRYGHHLRRYRENLQQSFRQWIRMAARLRGGRVADYLEADGYHLWHGDFCNRKYNARNMIMHAYDLQPSRDLKFNADGLQGWSGAEHPLIRQALADYFTDRQEDTPLNG